MCVNVQVAYRIADRSDRTVLFFQLGLKEAPKPRSVTGLKKRRKKVNFYAYACMCLGDGRESVSSRHFHVVVPQPIRFCILNKLANCNATFIFLRLMRHFQARRTFPSSVHSLLCLLCGRRRLMKTGPPPPE